MPIPSLKFPNLFGDVTRHERRIVPIKLPKGSGDDVLSRVVSSVRAWVVFCLRPISCEYLIGLSAKQEIVWISHLLTHYLSHEIIPVAHGPSSMLEIATCILVGSAWGLHNSIKRYK